MDSMSGLFGLLWSGFKLAVVAFGLSYSIVLAFAGYTIWKNKRGDE